MRVLVTGGAGFIGGWVSTKLLEAGFRVDCLDLNSSTPPCHVFHHVDIRDYAKMQELLQRCKFDAIVNLAALKSVQESYEKQFEYFQINSIAATELYKMAIENNVKIFLQASSAAVYRPSMSKISEMNDLDPISPYGLSKSLAEAHLLELSKKLNTCELVILRIFNVYGQKCIVTSKENDNFISNVIKKIRLGESVNVFRSNLETRDSSTVRDYIHVEDLSQGITNLLELHLSGKSKLPEAINLGSGIGVTSLEIASLIKEIVNSNSLISLTNSPNEEIPISISNVDLLLSLLPELSLREFKVGLRQQILGQ